MLNNWFSKKKKRIRSIYCNNDQFASINTFTMTHLKLPTQRHWTQGWEEMSTICSLEPVQAALSTGLLISYLCALYLDNSDYSQQPSLDPYALESRGK